MMADHNNKLGTVLVHKKQLIVGQHIIALMLCTSNKLYVSFFWFSVLTWMTFEAKNTVGLHKFHQWTRTNKIIKQTEQQKRWSLKIGKKKLWQSVKHLAARQSKPRVMVRPVGTFKIAIPLLIYAKTFIMKACESFRIDRPFRVL